MEDILTMGFAALGIAPPPGATESFRRYYELLSERNRVMNLTAIEGEIDTARLHFLDCAALLSLPELSFDGKRVIDVGTGAGLPGVAVAILCRETNLTLLDAHAKRTRFLEEVIETLPLTNTGCVTARAEEAGRLPEYRERYDIAMARAVARLDELCELCLPYVRVGGVFVAMKSADCSEELSNSARAIELLGGGDVRVCEYAIPGTALRRAAIVIQKRAATPERYPRRYSRISKAPLS